GRSEAAAVILDICGGLQSRGRVQLEGAALAFVDLGAGHDGRAICDWQTTVRSRNGTGRCAFIQRVSTLGGLYKLGVQRRDRYESDNRLGVGDWIETKANIMA